VAPILRGEIYWTDLNPARGHEQAGLRPVLILSNSLFNRRSGTVIGVAITSQPQRAGFPLTLALAPEQLAKPSWIKISQIRTISVERLNRRMGSLGEEELNRVVEGLIELIS
jgi:mRNA interferase MazF